MVPRVPPEEDVFTRFGTHDLSGLRVRKNQGALQDVEQLIGGEHRSETPGVAKRSARRKAEDGCMDQLGRDIDPVLDMPASSSPQVGRTASVARVAVGASKDGRGDGL